MHRLRRKIQWLHLAIALAVPGLLPVVASADSLFAGTSAAPTETVWVAPLAPFDAVPGDSGESMPPDSTEPFSTERYDPGTLAPGLQLSLNPVDEEFLVGWRFAF